MNIRIFLSHWFCKRSQTGGDDDIDESDAEYKSPNDDYGAYNEGGYDDYGDKSSDYDGAYDSVPSSPIKELFSVDEIRNFTTVDELEPSIIGFFDESTNNEDKIVFEEVWELPSS